VTSRPLACPRCAAGAVYREADPDGERWYCFICGWREPALQTLPAIATASTRGASHAGQPL